MCLKIPRILDQENITWIFTKNLVNVVRRSNEPIYSIFMYLNNIDILEYNEIVVTVGNSRILLY